MTWLTKKLGEAGLAQVRYGKTRPPENKGNVPVVGSSGVYGFCSAALINKPTIVVGRKGTAGGVFFLEGPCWPSDTTFYLEMDLKSVVPKFLFYSLLSKRLTGQHSKTTLPSLKREDLEDLIISVPPLPEQKKIVYVLDGIQEAVGVQEEIIDKTKELKKALMHKLFREGVIKGFMFDTNIFNHILDNEIETKNLPKEFNYYATHIQLDELEATKNQSRRRELSRIFSGIGQKNLPTESAVFGVSRYGKAKYSAEDGIYENIKMGLDSLEKKPNNIQDTLIAETAIKNRLVLVTDDRNLGEVTRKYKGEVVNLRDFLAGSYRKLKKTEIGEVPKSWEVVDLRSIAETKTGGTPSRGKSGYFDGTIPWVKSGELKDNIISVAEEKITEKGLANSSAQIFPKGTLLIALYGATVGRTAILDIDASTNQAICAILPKADLFLPDFLRSYLILGRSRILSERYGGAQPNISQTIIKNLRVPLPPLSEQKEIAKILQTVDQKIEIEEKKRELYEELFKAMLEQLMTGKIRINNVNFD